MNAVDGRKSRDKRTVPPPATESSARRLSNLTWYFYDTTGETQERGNSTIQSDASAPVRLIKHLSQKSAGGPHHILRPQEQRHYTKGKTRYINLLVCRREETNQCEAKSPLCPIYTPGHLEGTRSKLEISTLPLHRKISESTREREPNDNMRTTSVFTGYG